MVSAATVAQRLSLAGFPVYGALRTVSTLTAAEVRASRITMSPRFGIRSESDRDAQGSGHLRCYPLRWLLSTKHFMEKAITLTHGSQQAVDCMRPARKSRTSYSRLEYQEFLGCQG
jgi:hypothetical protein